MRHTIEVLEAQRRSLLVLARLCQQNEVMFSQYVKEAKEITIILNSLNLCDNESTLILEAA